MSDMTQLTERALNKGKPLLCLFGALLPSTVSDLVVTSSVLAVSISKTLLKDKNLRALLTFCSRKPDSSLQTSLTSFHL